MPYLEIPHLGRVHYHEYGSGEKLMFAFHGYGMTGKQFDVLKNSLMTEYRIIGFDHFFHGGSVVSNPDEQHILKGMKREDVKLYIEAWFEQFGARRFSLLGYSIGANFALLLAGFFGGQVDALYLMAPDGLTPHKGFGFLRRNFFGKRLFKLLTFSPSLATSGLNTLKRFRLLDDALHRIAYNEVNTAQKRLDVYYTLHFMKELMPDIPQVADVLNRNQIQTIVIFGQYDALFPKSNGRQFLSLVNEKEVLEVPMGHWLVTPQLDDILVKKK